MPQSSITNIQRILAFNLRKRRKKLGYTQMRLAEKCGISTSFIGEIESCKKFPSATTLQKLIDVLNISPAILFSDDYHLLAASETHIHTLHCFTVLRLKKEIDEVFNEVLKEGQFNESLPDANLEKKCSK